MSEAKPTPGEWKVAPLTPCRVNTQSGAISIGWASNHDDGARELEAEANALLIADAGNTYNTTGLTPSQLVERVKELEEALTLADLLLSGANMNRANVELKVRSALSKARPNTAEGEAHADNVREDAARWHEVLNHVGADNLLGGAQYVLRGIQAPVNVMQGSVAQHFTKSIDAARKQAAAKEPSP